MKDKISLAAVLFLVIVALNFLLRTKQAAPTKLPSENSFQGHPGKERQASQDAIHSPSFPTQSSAHSKDKRQLVEVSNKINQFISAEKIEKKALQFGDPNNPIVKHLAMFMLLHEEKLSPPFTTDEIDSYSQSIELELIQNSKDTRPFIQNGLKLTQITPESKNDRYLLYDMTSKFPEQDQPELRQMALSEVASFSVGMTSPGITDDGKPIAEALSQNNDPNSIVPIPTIKAFMASAGNDPQSTLAELRSSLANMNPLVRQLLEGAFRERYPSYQGKFE